MPQFFSVIGNSISISRATVPMTLVRVTFGYALDWSAGTDLAAVRAADHRDAPRGVVDLSPEAWALVSDQPPSRGLVEVELRSAPG